MAFKNLGPGVSHSPTKIPEPAAGLGQYTAEDHSFESLVIQQGKTVTDWEMNLLQEIHGTFGFQRLAQKYLPTCWLTAKFLEQTNVGTSSLGHTGDYIFLTPDAAATTANSFQLRAADLIFNGWNLRFDLSDLPAISSIPITPGLNSIVLPVPPVGGQRTDLVILEVWRALVSPIPSIVNKSPAGQILRYGNAKSPDAAPNENLADDIEDPTLLQETAKRVQIQYRYRVIQNVDIITFPDGLTQPGLVANTTPYLGGSGVDGNPTVYAFAPSATDPGLWLAGTGDAGASTAIGSVDGYMYAIPICAVFRRNSSAFSRTGNLNGGNTMAGLPTPTRPDAIYADQIVASDILDLRKGVAWDLEEVLQKSFNQVLDNSLSTEGEVNLASGTAGTSLFYKDDIGLNGHIGNPDAIRMNFSDRSVTETIVAKVVIGGGAVTQAVFNLNAILIEWRTAAENLFALLPINTRPTIVGVRSLRIVDATTDHDMLLSVSPVHAQSIVLDVNIGPQIDRCTVNFNVAKANATVYAELYIEYPAGLGASRNTTGIWDFWTPPAANINLGTPEIAAWVDPAQLTATSDVNREHLNPNQWWADLSHRELSARLLTLSQGPNNYFTPDGFTIFIPEILTGTVTINDGINPVYTTSAYTYNTNYTAVTLSIGVPINTLVTASFKALRAIPPTSAPPGDSYQLFYSSAAIQSIPVPAGTQTLNLTPRLASEFIHIITSGSGSPDEPFPFVAPSAQIPVGLLPSNSYPESRLDTPNVVNIIGFGINSGYIKVTAFVPYAPDPDYVTLYKSAPDVTIDGDGRNFWPKSDSGSVPVYSPIAFGQNLAFGQKHKVAYPVLMELKQDFPTIGRKGTILLVVISSWFEFSNQNNVQLTSILGASCAAVYRVRGNLLNPRRTLP